MKPYYESGNITIYHGDCRDFLAELPHEANAIITDPPYSSGGFQESGKSGGSIGTTREHGELPSMRMDNLSTRGYRRLMRSVFDAALPSLIYIFTDWRMWIETFDCAEDAGLRVRAMVVWNKGAPGMGSPWRSQHELVLFAVRETPEQRWVRGNVLTHARTGNKLHPTEKPVALIADLLTVTPAGLVVIDPFMGSGTTLIAARNAARRAIGIEIEERYCEIAARRLDQEVLDLTA